MRIDWPAFLLAHEVHNGLGSIDGSTAPNGDDGLSADLLVQLDAFLDVSDRRVLSDLPEGPDVGVVFLQDILDAPDNIRLFSSHQIGKNGTVTIYRDSESE